MRNPHPFESIIDYVESKSGKPPEYLDQLERETWLKMLSPQMVSGAHLGRFLSMISRLTHPKTVVEIGTFTGYAALCLAEGLASGGTVYTYEINPETQWLFHKYLDLSPHKDSIQQTMGDALEHIPDIPGEIDLSWIDADKKQNQNYFETVLSKTRTGGLIMIDNTLWSGKVLEADQDETTQLIDQFNERLKSDERVSCIMLPIRDGVTLAIKN